MEERERVTRRRITAYPAQWASWQRQAQREGTRSVSALIRRALTEYMLRHAAVVRQRRKS